MYSMVLFNVESGANRGCPQGTETISIIPQNIMVHGDYLAMDGNSFCDLTIFIRIGSWNFPSTRQSKIVP